MRIKVSFYKDWELGISGIISKHWKDIFIFLGFVEINIHISAKDWMMPSIQIVDGKEYFVYLKNEKYLKEPIRMFKS